MKSYYVVVKNNHSIEPLSRITNSDGTLKLTFSEQSLENFFNNKIIYKHEKAFPESQNLTLKNTYYIRTNSTVSKTDLASLSNVEFVEEINLNEGGLLFEPNDYFFL